MQTIVQTEFAKSVLESGDSIKTISAQCNTNVKTCHDTSNSDYQVPADRKYVIHSIVFLPSGAGVPQLRLWVGSTVDSSTGATQVLQDFEYKLTDNSSAVYIPCYIEVAAGNYVNPEASNSGEKLQIIVNGVETSA